ncbi:MAG: HEAT repeat domain-containing protein [Thermodesulfovibrionales bacterium]
MSSDELGKMLADYMENGFLDNIIDMFRHDRSLYPLVADLIRDERIRVRIGTTALLEELSRIDRANIAEAVPNILPLLEAADPVVRGDAVNLLGIIGHRTAVPFLEKMLHDEDKNVRILAQEALKDIG